jgi:branched-chain amino acid transport system ATP-binding protein
LATDLLALDRLNVYYGDSHVLHDVSWRLQAGRLLALLGRNGAGKSTTIHSIIGFLPTRSGAVRLDGLDIQNTAPELISRAGVGLVPQGRRIFGSLTVRENLDVAARRTPAGGGRVWTREDVNQVFPRLKERQHQVASSLSGGELQMLAIGRALMTSPRLLLLDEPSEGLAPQIVHEVQQVLQELKQQVSIVLVEQNLGLAMTLADDVVLLDTGRVVFAGTRKAFDERSDELQVHLGVH